MNHHLVMHLLVITFLSLSHLSYQHVSASQATLKLPKDIEDALDSAHLGRTSPDLVLKSWHEFIRRAPSWAEDWTSSMENNLRKILQKDAAGGNNNTKISKECQTSLEMTLNSVKNLDEWAIKFIDSWGKFPMSGVLEGTFSDFGSFDECINIPPNDIIGKPQYCTLDMRPLLPPRPRYHNLVHSLDYFYNFSSIEGHPSQINKFLIQNSHFFYYITLRIGVCLPSKCSVPEVDHLINEFAKEWVLQGRATRCEVKQPVQSLDGYQVIAVFTLIFLLLAASLGTFVDVKYVDSQDIPVVKLSGMKRCLLSFSIPRNFHNIFNTSNSSESHLACLHGFRVLTMGWVVMGHTYALTNHQAFARGFRITEIVTEFASQWFFNGTLSVDTFFFISGMLTTFVTWKMTRGDKRLFNLPAFLLARFIRLTPPLMVVIAFTFFLPLFGSGPGFHEIIDPVIAGCKKNWWTNLLYLTNWIDTKNICLLHTWFLASDMQFHFLSLVVVVPLFYSKVLGLAMKMFLLVGSIILAGVINYVNDYPPAMIYTQPEIEERWDLNIDYYWKPYSHIGPFCIGLGLGYFMATNKLTKLSFKTRMTGWITSLLILFLVLFGSYGWSIGMQTHALINALHSATHRTVWAVGLAWIIYACASGQGGFVNAFLSWKGFIPLSRLSFMVYLVHPWLIYLYMANLRQMIDTTHYTGFYIFLPHWVLSYLVGLVLTLLIESPVMGLQKELLRQLAPSRGSRSSRSSLSTEKKEPVGDGEPHTVLLPTYQQLQRQEAEANHSEDHHHRDGIDNNNEPQVTQSLLFSSPYSSLRSTSRENQQPHYQDEDDATSKAESVV